MHPPLETDPGGSPPAGLPGAVGAAPGRRSGFTAVIPAFNEVATIRGVVDRTLREVERVIVVDDGSTDGTSHALAGCGATVIRNPVNMGKAESLRRGMALAWRDGEQAVITLDADGQHDPADIPRLIDAHEREPDLIVIGARLHEKHNIPRARYAANRFASFWIGWAAGYPLTDSQSGFRLYPASLMRAVDLTRSRSRGFVFESEILITAARAGVRSVAVPIHATYRVQARPSYFRPVADILLITRMVAWKLLCRGMYIPGLIRSLRPERGARHYSA
jgi:glycosyltransferase involved in cell wall biosynthesis